MHRQKKSFFYGAYLILSVMALFLLAELGLVLADAVTGSTKFKLLGERDHARFGDLPDGHLGIAIFGGSAAFGWGSEATPDLILDVALRERYPGLEFRIDNQSETGQPFHGRQAVLVQYLIDKYDVFLIYAGHNEANYYYDETGYFRDEEHKTERDMKPFDPGKFDLNEWLRTHSHLFAMTQKINHVIVDRRFFAPRPTDERPKMGYWPNRPQLFEAEKAIPDEAMTKIYDNFEADLRAIGRLADERGKIVIVSSAPSHQEYPPFFSAHKAGLGDEELREFDNAYNRGVERFNHGNFEEAVDWFLIASKIDDRAALLNYMLGWSYMNVGDATRGQLHIQRSIDNDGLYKRASSSLARISESVAADYSSVHYVDTVRGFQQALDSGITNDELFGDIHHPSFMGHVIIAHSFLSKISELEPLKNLSPGRDIPYIDMADLRSLSSFYRGILGVPHWKVKRVKFSLAIWHYAQAPLTADPTAFLERGARLLAEYYELSDKAPEDEALLLMSLALLAAQRPDAEQAMILVEQAIQISPGLVQDFLYGQVYVDGIDLTGEWVSEFNRLGLEYSGAEKGLVLLSE